MTDDELNELDRLAQALEHEDYGGPWHHNWREDRIEARGDVLAYDIPEDLGPYLAACSPERIQALVAELRQWRAWGAAIKRWRGHTDCMPRRAGEEG